jgi:hypothetical protein
MMSKGTVTAEELKKQLGNAMPGAISCCNGLYGFTPQITSTQASRKKRCMQT